MAKKKKYNKKAKDMPTEVTVEPTVTQKHACPLCQSSLLKGVPHGFKCSNPKCGVFININYFQQIELTNRLKQIGNEHNGGLKDYIRKDEKHEPEEVLREFKRFYRRYKPGERLFT